MGLELLFLSLFFYINKPILGRFLDKRKDLEIYVSKPNILYYDLPISHEFLSKFVVQ